MFRLLLLLTSVTLLCFSGIVYAEHQVVGPKVIFAMPSDEFPIYGDRLGVLDIQTGEIIEYVTFLMTNPNMLSISEDWKVLYEAGNGVHIFDLQNKTDTVAISTVVYDDPVLSSDGKYIALTESDSLFVLRANDTEEATRIVDGNEIRSRFPTWSPDSSQLAFWGWQASESDEPASTEGGIYVINKDGTDLREIFALGNPTWPQWSSDGRHLSANSNYGVLLYDFEQERLRFPASRTLVLRWIDATTLLLTNHDGSLSSLNVATLDEERLLYPTRDEWGFIPSPDGEAILYSRRHADIREVDICIYFIAERSTECVENIGMSEFGLALWLPQFQS